MIAAIVNPASANGKTEKEWPAIRAALESEFDIVKAFFTGARFHAAELTRQVLKEGAITVIAIGGDGTLNEVVNGFFENGQPVNREARLAVLLRGTGGDFVRSCSFPRTIPEIVRSIKRRALQPCDLIRMMLEPLNSGPPERYCINVADVGVGGRVVNIVNNSPKSLGGTLSFFLAGLQATLFRYKNVPLRIELDGKVIRENTPHYFVAVANGSYFGGGMHIAPEAKLNNGLFEVVLVGNLTLPEKVYFALKLYLGKADQLEKVQVFRGRRLTISSPSEVFIEADGELVGRTNVTFEIIPSAINVVGLKST